MGGPVPLSQLALDLPEPAAGWAAELGRRGIPVELDDIGRPSITRAAARDLLTEHREDEARKARHRAETERQAVEADQAFRAQLPRGIPSAAVPAGVSAGLVMMLSDPFPSERRQSVLQHALEHQDGAIVFHPIGGES
jgi:hypothetical protein